MSDEGTVVELETARQVVGYRINEATVDGEDDDGVVHTESVVTLVLALAPFVSPSEVEETPPMVLSMSSLDSMIEAMVAARLAIARS